MCHVDVSQVFVNIMVHVRLIFILFWWFMTDFLDRWSKWDWGFKTSVILYNFFQLQFLFTKYINVLKVRSESILLGSKNVYDCYFKIYIYIHWTHVRKMIVFLRCLISFKLRFFHSTCYLCYINSEFFFRN